MDDQKREVVIIRITDMITGLLSTPDMKQEYLLEKWEKIRCIYRALPEADCEGAEAWIDFLMTKGKKIFNVLSSSRRYMLFQLWDELNDRCSENGYGSYRGNPGKSEFENVKPIPWPKRR